MKLDNPLKALLAKVLKYTEYKKVEELVASLEGDDGDKALEKVLKGIETAIDDEFDNGVNKITGMLGKGLAKFGFTTQIGDLDKDFWKEFGEKLKAHFAVQDDLENPNADKSVVKLKARIKELEDELDQTNTKHQEALAAKDEEVSLAKVREQVNSYVKDELTKLGAIIPTDAGLAKRKLERMLRELDEYSFEKDDKTGDYFLLKDGSRVRENGRYIKLGEKLPAIAETYYTLKEVEGKDPSGTPQTGGSGGDSKDFKFNEFKGTIPVSLEAANGLLADLKLSQAAKEEIGNWLDTNPFEQAA